MSYFIVNKRGNYVTSVNSVDLNSQKSIYSAENSELSLLKAAFKEKANQEGTLLLDGTEYQAHLTYLNNYNWVIVQIVPMSEITEGYEVMSNLQCIVFFCNLRPGHRSNRSRNGNTVKTLKFRYRIFSLFAVKSRNWYFGDSSYAICYSGQIGV